MSQQSTIDRVRNFWDQRPCNIRHSRQPLGSKAYFDEVEARKYLVEPHIPHFAEFAKWSGKKVLEIGCGLGTDSVNFARSGAELTVVDVSPRSIEMVRKRFAVYGLKATFHCGSAEELSSFLPRQEFDLVYSFGVIHHTPRPKKVFAEIQHYCGPRTEVRVMLYSKWSWKVLWIIMNYGNGAFWRADELVRTYSEAQTGCPVAYYYSFRHLRKLLRGFEIVEIWKDHIFPYKIDKYINYQYEREWYFRFMPPTLFHWLERRLGWHTLIIARPYLATGPTVATAKGV